MHDRRCRESRPTDGGPTDRRPRAGVTLRLAVCLLATVAGCERFSSGFTRSPLPDTGPRIPVSARVEFDPALTAAVLHYVDACNSPRDLRLGNELEAVLLQAAHQTFQTISLPGSALAATKPDVDISIVLEQSGLKIQTDNLYDRLPAELTLEATATFRDQSGNLLGQRSLKTVRRERLLLEPTQHRCTYVSIDAFLHDAAVSVAVQFIREARALLEPGAGAAGRPAPASPGAGAATLSFKASVLDENANLVLESGERVRVRVDLVNSGTGPVAGVSVSLSGTPALVTQFPATTLPVGALQPGESRSIEFSGTVPQSLPAMRAELTVSVREASGAAVPAAQTLVMAVRSAAKADSGADAAGAYADVDTIPLAAAGFQRPRTYLLAIGLETYRDRRSSGRKFAGRDAELVAAYAQALGGVPPDNVRVLQDRKASHADIEEALLDWLPPRVTPDSTVIVYFAGQAGASASGDLALVPYEGTGKNPSRLYPLKELYAALTALHAQYTLLIFDGSVVRLEASARSKSKAPRWELGGEPIVRLIGTTGFQPGLEPAPLRHGLFTYYLLRGLNGEADADLDGQVTLGELAGFLGRSVPPAAKRKFRQEQRPLVLPALAATGKDAALVLTVPRTAASPEAR